MREYTIVRRPDDFSWDTVPALDIDYHHNTAQDMPISAKAQLCYDDAALYVRLTAVESQIRAELTGVLDEICEDSCLEFFFSPMDGDRRYINLECNLNGAMYMGFGTCVDDLMRLIPEEAVIFPKGQTTADGWEVTYAVPHAFVRRFFPEYAPAPGTTCRGNFYKCGDKTVQKHYLTWNPIVPLPRASFHNPDRFGILHFA